MSENHRALPRVFTVGDWRIDGNALTARRKRASRALEPKALRVLRYLCERPAQLVTIDELMEAEWEGTVVTPNAVSRIIAQLRKTLEDDAKDPVYIETVARTGYRMIATVRPETSAPARKRLTYAALAAVAAIALGAVFYLWPGEPSEPTVAVLPFQNMTGSADADYIGDGVAEEVINSLTSIPALRVRTHLDSFRYRDPDTDPAEIARELNVNFIVAGSVRRSGPNLRLAAQVIDPRTGQNLHSITEEYGSLELFEGQDAVSRGIADALLKEAGLPPQEFDFQKPQPDSVAYDHYLRGRHIWHRRGTEPLQPAIDNFLEAVKIDPEFARGWAALATAYLTYPSYSPRGYATWNLAEEAAEKALELDPQIGEAYSVLAVFAHTRFEWSRSEQLYLEGIALAENSATAHYWYGQFLEIVGKSGEGVRHVNRAIELDPTYLPPQLTMAFAHYTFGDLEEAGPYLLELWRDRNFRTPLSWTGNFMVAMLTGDADSADQWIEYGPMDDAQKRLLRRFVAADLRGQEDPALVEDLATAYWRRPDYPLGLWLLARRGGFDEALALANDRLDRGLLLETRSLWAPGMALREQPEFLDLLNRIGLIEYWNASGWGDVCVETETRVDCSGDARTPELLERLLSGDTAD